MWASHFVRNGNKLSVSSWLAIEVQVCRNVGRPNPRRPNLVLIIFVITKCQWKICLFSFLKNCLEMHLLKKLIHITAQKYNEFIIIFISIIHYLITVLMVHRLCLICVTCLLNDLQFLWDPSIIFRFIILVYGYIVCRWVSVVGVDQTSSTHRSGDEEGAPVNSVSKFNLVRFLWLFEKCLKWT